MKKLTILAFATVAVLFGCKKDINYLSETSTADSTPTETINSSVTEMRNAFNQASSYNDSLKNCMDHMMGGGMMNGGMMHMSGMHDSMYHHNDSIMLHHHNICHSNMSSCCSMSSGGHMGMMDNGNMQMDCSINDKDCTLMMDSLHQVHSQYCPK